MLYQYFASNGINSFGEYMKPKIDAFCSQSPNDPLIEFVCNYYIMPAFNSNAMKEKGMKVS